MDINEPIRGIVELTRGEAVKHGVSVRTELVDDLPLLEGDRVELQQVVRNLIMNALEAMSSTSDGPRTLSISTGRAEPSGVLVVIGDSGPGLAPASIERLFDAFYTTKPGGLGLSICRSIIEAHGGQLWASPRAPHGTAFHFTVPIARAAAQELFGVERVAVVPDTGRSAWPRLFVTPRPQPKAGHSGVEI